MNPDTVLRIGKVFETPYGGDGVDFVDQLNYQFTGGLLIIFIAVIGVRQYVDVNQMIAIFETGFLNNHF
ncbi:uncharacterized protein DC041_0009585 [Schistosoma bovis]|uniref:TMhelix containing protein n=2 Tax=Schistosoma TaxID=6181 RepID=A0A183L406_9TREM|nr:uncharacterized protein DC041_0009585 [Schistosoma bovis]VDP77580.1 unnamed protein product [Schistosoma curassoni]